MQLSGYQEYVVTKNILSTCKLYGLSLDSSVNGKLSCCNDRLFTVSLSEVECRIVAFVDELIQLQP